MTCHLKKAEMTDLDITEVANTQKRNSMPPIDLTLAINFIPAVVCLCKAALISLSLSFLRPGHYLGGFVILAMMLNIDRAVSCARIFDENAVQFCIISAWGINFLRSTVPYTNKILNPVAMVLWLCFTCCLVLEPKAVQEFFVIYGHGSGGVFKRVLPSIITGLFIVVMAFIPFQAEPPLITGIRSLSFAGLCVTWVYVVSIWRPKPRHNGSCVFECHLLLSRFCPILYIDREVAVFYVVCCVIILTFHYVDIHVSSSSGCCLTESGGVVSVGSNLRQPSGFIEDSTENSILPSENVRMNLKKDLKNDAKSESKAELVLGAESSTLSDVKIMVNDVCQMNTIDEEDEDLEALFRSAYMCRNE